MGTKIIDLLLPTEISENDIDSRLFIHSVKKFTKYGEVIVIKEKVKTSNGSIYPNVRCIENPKRTFYITKPPYRTHKYKKEYEYEKNLDKFYCYDHQLLYDVKAALGIRNKSIYNIKSLCNNPYLYKADIDIEPLIKMSYMDKYPDAFNLPVSVGFLDIETDIHDNNSICIISFTHDNHIFTTFLNHRMYQEDENHNLKPFTFEELQKRSLEFYKEEIEKYDLKFHYFIANSVKEMLEWTFKTIHDNNTDIIGIWNLGFDIPVIIENALENNIKQEDLFIPEYIPPSYRYFNYKHDTYNRDHYSLKWHWLSNTSGTQFIDSLSLYSTLRKTAGFEESYKLEYILSKYIGKGKVLNLDANGHTFYANRRYMDYIIYNQFDVIGLYLLETKNRDIVQLLTTSAVVPISKFNLMTKRITYDHFYYFSKRGIIISSIGKDQVTEEDLIKKYLKVSKNIEINKKEAIPKYGGAVLRPERCRGVGINPFTGEFDNSLENDSLFSMSVSDMDLSSAYPTNMMSYNISRSTADCTLFNIEGKSFVNIHDLFNNLVAKKENAYYIVNKFFNLPNYLDF